MAQVGLDGRRLDRLLQEYTGFGHSSWLVDDQGRSLTGRAENILPDDAARRGVMAVENDAEGQATMQVWAPLPTTGWRLVSHLPLPEKTQIGAALGWVALAWGIGSLLILVGLTMLLRQRVQRWEQELNAPVTRMARLRQRVVAWAPAWLSHSPSKVVELPNEQGQHLATQIVGELDALEATLAQLAYQPRLERLIEGLDRPALLTHNGLLVAVNVVLEHLVGRTQGEFSHLWRQSRPRHQRCEEHSQGGQGDPRRGRQAARA